MMSDTTESGKPVRAIIADDHPLVLLAINNLMSGYPDIEIVGRAADTTELFTEVDRNPCDLVLMDLYMPGGFDGHGFDAVKQFKERYPNVALVVLTMETQASALQRVISRHVVLDVEYEVNALPVAPVSHQHAFGFGGAIEL